MNVFDIFRLFKEFYPKNGESFIPTRDNVNRWIYRINLKQSIEFPLVQQYWDATSKRQFPFVPDYHLNMVGNCIEDIVQKFPLTKEIFLVGSFAEGTWIDRTTQSEFKLLKQSIENKYRISDYNFKTNPPVEYQGSIYSILKNPWGLGIRVYGKTSNCSSCGR